MTIKTNAMRLLDSRRIEYTVLMYAWDGEYMDVLRVAAAVDLPPDRVFKTLPYG